jgi:hypothetical protein
MSQADTSPISPEDAQQLRTVHRVRVEVLTEYNVLDEDEAPFSRDDVRVAWEDLTQEERTELHRRTRSRLRELNDLMDGDSESFEAPAVEHGDLVDGVRIPGYYD